MAKRPSEPASGGANKPALSLHVPEPKFRPGDEADFSHVHFFISGGAPCPPKLIEDWSRTKGVTMRQGYGLTEVGVNCFSMTDEDALRKAGSVGKPVFHSQMRLVDTDGNPKLLDLASLCSPDASRRLGGVVVSSEIGGRSDAGGLALDLTLAAGWMESRRA